MPAVQLTRLKTQLTELAWQFPHPQEFRRSLDDLFEFYSDRVYRAGRNVQPDRLYPAYHVPALVMQQIELELIPRCRENPEAALTTADALWKDDHLEPRLVAAFLLGQVTVQPPDGVIRRLKEWCQPKEERNALEAALRVGSTRLRKELPNQWFALVRDWVTSPYPTTQAMGLQAMIATIQEKDFNNFPPVFDLLVLILPNPPISLQNELIEIIQILGKRSSTETVYFLREMLAMSSRPTLARLIRRCLLSFDPAGQENLRTAMKNQF
jgi:hypothetical protein